MEQKYTIVEHPDPSQTIANMKAYLGIRRAAVVPSETGKETYLIGDRIDCAAGNLRVFTGDIYRTRVKDGKGESFGFLAFAYQKGLFIPRRYSAKKFWEIGGEVMGLFYEELERGEYTLLNDYTVPTFVVSADGSLFGQFDQILEEHGFRKPFDGLYKRYRRIAKMKK